MRPVAFTILMVLIGFQGLFAAEIMPACPNSDAIAGAIEQASPGDIVHLAPEVYIVHDAIRLKPGVSIMGAGQERTFLRFEGRTNASLLDLSGCTDVEVRGLTLDGNNNPNARQGISAGHASGLRIRHVTIRNLAKGEGFGPHGILFAGQNPTREGGVTGSEIADCRFERIGIGAEFGCAIRLSWGSSHNRILRNIIEHTGRGGIFTDNGSTDIVIQGNIVSGSGGEGLGIEAWGGSDRTVIEDNRLDHWLSIGGSDYCAVRRNTISDPSGRYAFCGIEAIGSNLIVTGNTVDAGQKIGLSVSGGQAKEYVYWAGNTVRGCNQWGAQFQGEQGGIAYHYLYRCTFERMPLRQGPVWYPGDEGHGFRINGHTRHVTFDRCVFRDNGRHGIQFVGENIDALAFRNCSITGNHGSAFSRTLPGSAIEWTNSTVHGNADNELPPGVAAAHESPRVSIRGPSKVRPGETSSFGVRTPMDIAYILWDFDEGVPITDRTPKPVFHNPGKHGVTVIVWDRQGNAARAEKVVNVLNPD